jgi:hypothetical protein
MVTFNYVFFVSINSGLVMDVRGGTITNNSLIQQYGFHGGHNQRWLMIPAPTINPQRVDGEFYIASGSSIGKGVIPEFVVDIAGASLDDGAAVQLFAYHGGDNQVFRFDPIAKEVINRYSIIARHSGKCLDVEHVSTAQQALVHQIGYHGAPNQQWHAVSLEFLNYFGPFTGAELPEAAHLAHALARGKALRSLC